MIRVNCRSPAIDNNEPLRQEVNDARTSDALTELYGSVGPGVFILPLLEGRGLSKHFGGVHALREVTFAVEPQTIVGLIGPNGAGKTTLFNAIAGVFKPSSGKVIFDGIDITRLPANQTCRRGISRKRV